MGLFEILALDSAIFGYPVARILPDHLAVDVLAEVISRLREEKVRLIFWATNPKDEESQRAARLHQGFLADKKVTFVSDLQGTATKPPGRVWETEVYSKGSPSAEMEALAVQVGENSRFGADPRMPADKYRELYKIWIRNSVNGKVADAVLVVRQADKVVGMATVGRSEERGFIGLFAVDAAMRGKSVGVSLVCAAHEWSRREGLRIVQVVTQSDNIAACKLYRKCGYNFEKVEYFYHFWI